jgi:hypothetical protein
VNAHLVGAVLGEHMHAKYYTLGLLQSDSLLLQHGRLDVGNGLTGAC